MIIDFQSFVLFTLQEVINFITNQINQLSNPETRENALLELSKKRESVPDLAVHLWHSFGTIAGEKDLKFYFFLLCENRFGFEKLISASFFLSSPSRNYQYLSFNNSTDTYCSTVK
jgi:hypothetical protein